MWRMLNGLLPFDDVLHRMGISFASRCPFCPNIDSQSHALFECSLARDLWCYFGSLFGFIIPLTDLRTFLFSIWNHRDPNLKLIGLLPSIICWNLWKVRNKYLFEGIIPTVTSLVASTTCQLHQLTLQNPLLVPSHVHRNYAFLPFPVLRKRIVFAQPMHWLCPHGPWKLNADGSSLGNPGHSGGGVVVCDPYGHVLFAETVYFGHATSMSAESRALLHGLQLCAAHGLFSIQVETDSQSLFHMLQSSNSWPWNIYSIIWSLCKLFFVMSQCHLCISTGRLIRLRISWLFMHPLIALQQFLIRQLFHESLRDCYF